MVPLPKTGRVRNPIKAEWKDEGNMITYFKPQRDVEVLIDVGRKPS